MTPEEEFDRELAEMMGELAEMMGEMADGYYTRSGRYRALPVREEPSPSPVRRLWPAIVLLWIGAILFDAAGVWFVAGAEGLAGCLLLTLALVGPDGVLRR